MKKEADLNAHTVIGVIGAMIAASLVVLVWAVSASNTIRPIGIIIHHSGLMPPIMSLGAMTRDRLPMDVESWDAFHQRRGFRAFYWGHFYHIGYHYLIFPTAGWSMAVPNTALVHTHVVLIITSVSC